MSLSKPVHQAGFTLVSAIFILVVLAGLGAAILMVSSNQQLGSALDVQGTRAYQAARAGIEWGVYQVNSVAAYDFGHACPASDTFSMCSNRRSCENAAGTFKPSAPSLASYTVTVTCTTPTPSGGLNGGPQVFVVESIASVGNVGTTSFIERRLRVVF
ncbi:hypothetical protein [Denitratisoma sp. DHT3]|uniref:hypothetical protein n=1 Tax=Denitratisoma sp. DHT3 TaxID=1981880 RepID=UPI0011A6777E|nr:hypothetical protein [Denitratisoma sp. DHT3]